MFAGLLQPVAESRARELRTPLIIHRVVANTIEPPRVNESLTEKLISQQVEVVTARANNLRSEYGMATNRILSHARVKTITVHVLACIT
jgi:hypothetical protein